MRRILLTCTLLSLAVVSVSAALSTAQTRRIHDAAAVLTEIHSTPDKDIPEDLWENARCVLVVPGLKKAAFIFGGEYGKGLLSCRQSGKWSPPLFMRLEKGSWGLQIGAQSIDLVLLINGEQGVEKLLSNKVTLGAEISVAAGPVGRDARAATDAALQAEILSYSRTQGLFAGINLSGGVLRPDEDDNRDLYGGKTTPRDVVLGGSVPHPAEGAPLMTALRRGM